LPWSWALCCTFVSSSKARDRARADVTLTRCAVAVEGQVLGGVCVCVCVCVCLRYCSVRGNPISSAGMDAIRGALGPQWTPSGHDSEPEGGRLVRVTVDHQLEVSWSVQGPGTHRDANDPGRKLLVAVSGSTQSQPQAGSSGTSGSPICPTGKSESSWRRGDLRVALTVPGPSTGSPSTCPDMSGCLSTSPASTAMTVGLLGHTVIAVESTVWQVGC
jgi:hypothetical protein